MTEPVYGPEREEFWMPENWPAGRAPARYDVERDRSGWIGRAWLRVPEALGGLWKRNNLAGPLDAVVSRCIAAARALEHERDCRLFLEPADLALLEESQRTHKALDVVVNACAYSCCGRGWQRRDGYEQTYRGYVDNLEPPAGGMVGTFMLYSAGIGGISYVIAARFHEVELVAGPESR